MASNFVRMTPLGRSKHPSIVALAAYRAGERLTDRRQNEHFDHRERSDVVHKRILLPDGAVDGGASWALDRQELWNRVQETDLSKRARYAHEWMLALPHELPQHARVALAERYAEALVRRYGSAVDLVVHEPRPEGDARNHHAHLLVTTREVRGETFGAKTDLNQSWPTLQARGVESAIKQWYGWRDTWVEYANEALTAAGLPARLSNARVDEFGLRIPTKPGWSRAVEGLVRAGHDSAVADAELKRYDFELRRRELEIKALEVEARLDRLRAARAELPHPGHHAASAGSAGTKPDGRDLVPEPEPMPVDFAGWLVWRAKQNFDHATTERQAIEAWQAIRARENPKPNLSPPTDEATLNATGPRHDGHDQDLGIG